MMKNKRISFEIHSIIKDLLRNCWIVVLVLLTCRMGVYVAERYVYEPEYTASATMVVSAKGANSATYSNFAVSADLAEIFANIFTDPIIKTKASEHIGRSFNGKISSSVRQGTNFITLSVTSASPQNSYELLNAVLKVYPSVSDYIFSNATVMVLKAPSVPKGASNSISSDDKSLLYSGAAIVSAFLIVVFSVLRDTVKDEEDFNEKVDAKLISTVMHERKRRSLKSILKRKKQSLRIHSNAFISFSFVENFHKISSKLEFMNRRDGHKVFVISSISENEGKSTVATNIALSLAEKGKKVLLLDFDFKKPALYKIFDLEYAPQFEMGEYLDNPESGRIKFRKFRDTSLFLAVSTKPHKESTAWVESGKLEKFVAAVSDMVDFVIIDTAPVMADASTVAISKFADKLLMVVRTDTVKTELINKTLSTLKDSGVSLAGCILNDVHGEFVPFDLFGADETGSYYKSRSKYGKYHKYGKYYKYGRYGKYGRYSGYGKYSRYFHASSYYRYSKKNQERK